MKHVFIVLLLTSVMITTASSQVPQLITHNGYLTDSTGAAVTGNRPMTLRLYQDSTTAIVDWSQTFPVVTITNGV